MAPSSAIGGASRWTSPAETSVLEPNHVELSSLPSGSEQSEKLRAIAERFPDITNRDLSDILRLAGPKVVRLLESKNFARGIDAEELVADAVVRFWQYRRGFNPRRGSITAYLYAIARNLAFELHRNASRDVATLQNLERFAAHEVPSDSDSVQESSLLRDTREILSEWSTIDRDILLAWAEKRTTNWATEFAQSRDDVTANWVRVRRFRLVDLLRAELAARGQSVKGITK